MKSENLISSTGLPLLAVRMTWYNTTSETMMTPHTMTVFKVEFTQVAPAAGQRLLCCFVALA
jgi:hypothetical protein